MDFPACVFFFVIAFLLGSNITVPTVLTMSSTVFGLFRGLRLHHKFHVEAVGYTFMLMRTNKDYSWRCLQISALSPLFTKYSPKSIESKTKKNRGKREKNIRFFDLFF